MLDSLSHLCYNYGSSDSQTPHTRETKKMAKKISGYILEETVSVIDGAPIVVIATMKTVNAKTGNMVQVWILRSDMTPTEAVKSNCDISICGNCPHRANGSVKERTCYVTVFQAPLAIFKAYKRGNYVKWDGDASVFAGRKIRWGAYGDPSLVNPAIVASINAVSDGWTGYTHQWKNEFAAPFVKFFQASCDSVNDLEIATDGGWGSFTVLPVGFDIKAFGQKVTRCPAAISDKVKCIDCGLCNGSQRHAHKVVIEAHGRNADDIKWA